VPPSTAMCAPVTAMVPPLCRMRPSAGHAIISKIRMLWKYICHSPEWAGFMGDLAACTAALRCANGRKAGNRTLSRPEADDALPYSARRREKDRALAATEPA
jgi:hypothetical protein